MAYIGCHILEMLTIYLQYANEMVAMRLTSQLTCYPKKRERERKKETK
jgi:hypothetical protein